MNNKNILFSLIICSFSSCAMQNLPYGIFAEVSEQLNSIDTYLNNHFQELDAITEASCDAKKRLLLKELYYEKCNVEKLRGYSNGYTPNDLVSFLEFQMFNKELPSPSLELFLATWPYIEQELTKKIIAFYTDCVQSKRTRMLLQFESGLRQ